MSKSQQSKANERFLEQQFHELKKQLAEGNTQYDTAKCTIMEYELPDGKLEKHIRIKPIKCMPRSLADCAKKSGHIYANLHKSISRAGHWGEAGNATIYLNNKCQIVGGKSYLLGRTAVKIVLPKGETQYLYLWLDEAAYVDIAIGIENGITRAFLLCIAEPNSVEIIVELKEFCMIASVMKDNEEDSEKYLLTCFNKKRKILFSQLIENIEDVDLSLQYNIADSSNDNKPQAPASEIEKDTEDKTE